jgi:hypothetical protein
MTELDTQRVLLWKSSAGKDVRSFIHSLDPQRKKQVEN